MALDDLKTPELPFNTTKGETSQKDKNTSEDKNSNEEIYLIQKFEELDLNQIQQLDSCGLEQDWFNLIQRKTDGRILWNVSYVGTIKIAQELRGFELIGMPIAQHTKDEFVFIVIAKCIESGVCNPGLGNIPKNMFGAMRSALSIATRNAYRVLLPLDEVKKYFAEWFEKKFEIRFELYEKEKTVQSLQEYFDKK